MKNKCKTNRIQQIYSILICITIILVGAAFIYHVLNIYYTGVNNLQSTYTKEIVISHLKQLIIPMIVLIVLIIEGNILSNIYKNNSKTKFKFSNYELYKKISKNMKFCLDNIDDVNKSNEAESIYLELKKLNKTKLIFIIVTSLICLASSIYGFIYLFTKLNVNNSNPNQEIVSMAISFIPFIVFSFVSIIYYVLVEEKLAKKQIECIRKLKKLNALIKIEDKKNTNDSIIFKRILVSIISISFIVIGILDGNLATVLKKAITICSECIGLG